MGRLRRFAHRALHVIGLHAFGDCSRCRHSFAYHMPLMGCIKCNCEEYQ